jgi:hypothetical protein
MMGRNLFYPHWAVEAAKKSVGSIKIPTDQKTAPRLAEKPTERVLAFVGRFGAGLTPARSSKVADYTLLQAAHCSHTMFKHWMEWKRETHPVLATALEVMHTDMAMGAPWDVNGYEMIVCEMAKGLVGYEIASGRWPTDEAQKGRYHAALAVLGSGEARAREGVRVGPGEGLAGESLPNIAPHPP